MGESLLAVVDGFFHGDWFTLVADDDEGSGGLHEFGLHRFSVRLFENDAVLALTEVMRGQC